MIAHDYDENYSAFSREITVSESGQPDGSTNSSDTPFSLKLSKPDFPLQEGASEGLGIPVEILRSPGFHVPVQLSMSTQTAADEGRLNLSNNTVGASETSSILNVELPISKLPIVEEQIRLLVNNSWNAYVTNEQALGNTALFERALLRVNKTLLDTGGILRGILWHQGFPCELFNNPDFLLALLQDMKFDTILHAQLGF